MNKIVLCIILPLAFTLQAKKDSVFDALERRDLKAVRHALWRIKVTEEDLVEFRAYAEDLKKQYETQNSVFKSLPDLTRTIIGAALCLGGLCCAGFVFPMLYKDEQDPSIMANFRKANYGVASAICLAGAYWMRQGLACRDAQSRVNEMQDIVKYIETFSLTPKAEDTSNKSYKA